ncbi:transposable element Tcb2 transposase [Trichonephila clavipes]|nr:transposable element Tcb2 transposase [Trichonephila clavipes]
MHPLEVVPGTRKLDYGGRKPGRLYRRESRFNLSNEDNSVHMWRPRGAIFQQGNTRPYTARVSQDSLCTVTTLTWPARFPDLSQFELIWDYLGPRIWHPTSLNELAARLQQI